MSLLRLLFLFALITGGFGHSAGQTATPSAPDKPAAAAQSSDFDKPRRLMDQGKYDEAIAQLQELAAKDPARKGLARELGMAYYKKGDYMKAIDSLKKATEELPADNEATQLLGLSRSEEHTSELQSR